MNVLNSVTRSQVVSTLVEGNSIRATCRLTGVAKNTVAKLLRELGPACLEYQQRVLRNLNCQRVQCDEIWAFVGCKEKNATAAHKATGCGDAWTWTAICSETKLMIAWYVGDRGELSASKFMHDLSGRLAHRVQLTTDGHRVYLDAVEDAFGAEIDYAQLVKIYGTKPDDNRRQYLGAERRRISGKPDLKKVSTSHVERANLTMRMTMRRFTRKTNAFSKKVEMLRHAVALTFMHYNFCRIHQTLRVTPAMEAGITDHVWDVEEIINLIQQPAMERAA